MDRGSIEAASDLTPEEIEAAKVALRAKPPRLETGRLSGCSSYVSRKLNCGWLHACRILDVLVAEGFITDPDDRGERALL